MLHVTLPLFYDKIEGQFTSKIQGYLYESHSVQIFIRIRKMHEFVTPQIQNSQFQQVQLKGSQNTVFENAHITHKIRTPLKYRTRAINNRGLNSGKTFWALVCGYYSREVTIQEKLFCTGYFLQLYFTKLVIKIFRKFQVF